MQFLRSMALVSLTFGTVLFAGCGDDTNQNNNTKSCSVEAQTGCSVGLVCEEVEGKDPMCLAPVSFKGKVIDALTGMPIKDALVVARDANDAAVSQVAMTDVNGLYALNVPAKRDAQGKPVAAKLTLRADAAGYQTFPLAPRVALPIDINTAAGDPPVVQNAATDIALIPIDSAGLGTISGRVLVDPGLDLNPAGALVVAGGSTGVVDFKGNFTVFNVAAGTGVEVHAYAAGLQIEAAAADVTAGKLTPNVDLHVKSAATAKVTGSVQIVNGGGASVTSVVLALKDTFVPDAARGEVPKGLRVGNVTGPYEFTGVPDGNYVILAAFENDGLVRDPDLSIGGTAILDVSIVGGASITKEGFKVTGALSTESPGKDAIEDVMGTPTFVWGDDSSEDHYELRVFDAFGKNIWQDLAVPSKSGSKTVSAMYGGDPLKPGMIYQFRATSIGKDGVPIAQTEDLRGVFVYR